jgi:dGTP triphosphohydrolase
VQVGVGEKLMMVKGNGLRIIMYFKHMKYIYPLIIIISGCGSGAAEKEAQQRKLDSIAAARIDSINNERRIEELSKQYLNVDSAKNQIQIEYDAVLVRLDSLTEFNEKLEEKLIKKTSEASKLKEEIGKIMAKPVLNSEESVKVKLLIGKLNGVVDRLVKGK